jgi:hypothetical protein
MGRSCLSVRPSIRPHFSYPKYFDYFFIAIFILSCRTNLIVFNVGSIESPLPYTEFRTNFIDFLNKKFIIEKMCSLHDKKQMLSYDLQHLFEQFFDVTTTKYKVR